MSNEALSILKKHGLRKTLFRIEVLSVFLDNKTRGLTSHFIESSLTEFDRITLYRTLKTFEQKGIIHNAIDSSQTTKFALCHESCSEHNHIDDHAHFLCNDCGVTYCLEEVIQPQISLPDSYRLEKSHLALSGTCAACNV